MRNSLLAVTKKTIAIVVVLGVVWAAKDFYRGADHESLGWLLAPTAFLVELISGTAFDNEPGLGWVNGNYAVTIALSCSGMNYLIILFCMSSLSAVLRLKSATSLACWIVFSALTSYGFTLFVNSLRIWLAIVLYDADIYSVAVTAESVHRFAGVLIYYFFMVFYYLLVLFILNLTADRGQCPSALPCSIRRAAGLLWPLCFYLLFTVVMPYLRGAATGQHFIEHIRMVAGASVGLTIFLGLGIGWYLSMVRRPWSFNARRQHNKA